MNDSVADRAVRTRKPVRGLRRKPGRLAIAVFRLPLNAYRHDAGWLLGHTFLGFTHTGRKTGMPHEAVAMVLHRDTATGEAVICAAWGPQTDWYLNLRAHPAPIVRIGRESYTPQQRFLSEDEAFDVAVAFRRDHPHRLRLVGRSSAGATCATTTRSARSFGAIRSSRSAPRCRDPISRRSRPPTPPQRRQRKPNPRPASIGPRRAPAQHPPVGAK